MLKVVLTVFICLCLSSASSCPGSGQKDKDTEESGICSSTSPAGGNDADEGSGRNQILNPHSGNAAGSENANSHQGAGNFLGREDEIPHMLFVHAHREDRDPDNRRAVHLLPEQAARQEVVEISKEGVDDRRPISVYNPISEIEGRLTCPGDTTASSHDDNSENNFLLSPPTLYDDDDDNNSNSTLSSNADPYGPSVSSSLSSLGSFASDIDIYNPSSPSTAEMGERSNGMSISLPLLPQILPLSPQNMQLHENEPAAEQIHEIGNQQECGASDSRSEIPRARCGTCGTYHPCTYGEIAVNSGRYTCHECLNNVNNLQDLQVRVFEPAVVSVAVLNYYIPGAVFLNLALSHYFINLINNLLLYLAFLARYLVLIWILYHWDNGDGDGDRGEQDRNGSYD